MGREKDKNSISISHTYSRLSDVENVNTDSFYFLKLFSPGAVCTTRMARTTCTKLGKRTGFSLTRSVLDSMIVDCLAKKKREIISPAIFILMYLKIHKCMDCYGLSTVLNGALNF